MALLCVLVLGGGGWAVSVALAASGLSAPSLSESPSANPTASTSITFSYSDSPGTTFTCKLDNVVKTCSGTKSGSVSFSSLVQGSHTFQIQAVSGSNTSPTSSYTWTIDTTPPTANTITRAGSSPTSASSVSWTVGFSESVFGVSASNFSLAPSGLSGTPSITNVTGSGATWTVTASDGSGTPANGSAGTLQLNLSTKTGITDLAGNALSNTLNGTSASLYQIDRFTPAPMFTSKPPNPNTTATSTFVWTEQEAGDHFLCSIENGSFQSTVPSAGGSPQPCSSPLTYDIPNTSNGTHQFAVEAVDAVGNVSSSISYSWKVQKDSGVNYTIGSVLTAPLLPGAPPTPINLTFQNPNSDSEQVSSVTVTIQSVTGGSNTPNPCTVADFAVTQYSGSYPFYVPAGSSSLSTISPAIPPSKWPTIRMIDRQDSPPGSGNGSQNGCVGANIHLTYASTP